MSERRNQAARRAGIRAFVVLATILGSLSSSPGQDFERPTFSFLRQDEDWSGLADATAAERSDPFDPAKYVRLKRDGSMWVSFGGSARARFEGWSDFAFGQAEPSSDSFSLWRWMGHADWHLGSRARVFLQAKSALANGRQLPGGARTVDLDGLALQQAFFDVGLSKNPTRVVLRLGRRGLQYGKQRLISPLPWGNTLRAWDGASLRLEAGPWAADAFWTQPVLVRPHDSNPRDRETEFFGAYATRKTERWTADLYLLGLETKLAAYNGTSGEERRYTIGTRLQGKLGRGGLVGEIEAAVQSGRVGNGDVAAWMLTLVANWPLGSGASSPQLSVALDLATGDRSPGGDVQTFNQLYPLGHAYLGIADFVGRQNIQALSASLRLRPFRKWRFALTPHAFRRFEAQDALYHAGGGVAIPGGADTSRQIGAEFDAVATYHVHTHLSIEFGWAHFFAGEFVEQAVDGTDMDFGYLQFQFAF